MYIYMRTERVLHFLRLLPPRRVASSLSLSFASASAPEVPWRHWSQLFFAPLGPGIDDAFRQRLSRSSLLKGPDVRYDGLTIYEGPSWIVVALMAFLSDQNCYFFFVFLFFLYMLTWYDNVQKIFFIFLLSIINCVGGSLSQSIGYQLTRARARISMASSADRQLPGWLFILVSPLIGVCSHPGQLTKWKSCSCRLVFDRNHH